MATEELSFAAFARRCCERQDQTPTRLLEIFRGQEAAYAPVGWFMAECQLLDSSRAGDLTVLPYGPNNTFKEPPSAPFSPRGLASDTSVAVAHCLAASLPESADHVEAEQWWKDVLHDKARREVEAARKAKRRKPKE